MPVPTWLWSLFTVAAAGAQTLRNAMQRELTNRLGTVGATHVRFLFGLPFALLFAVLQFSILREPVPSLDGVTVAWTAFGALAQIAATALMLAAMRERSFVVTIVYTKSEPMQVAVFGLLVLGDAVTAALVTAIVVATEWEHCFGT
jgi:drug/metabolite transporter (DMT)-like permease